MIARATLVIWSILGVSAAAAGTQDRGDLWLGPRQESRTKVFRDGRSIVAYRQSGTMTRGIETGPWKQATLSIQGTLFKEADGRVEAEAALWETIDPDGDIVWCVLWQPADGPRSLQIKAGTGKWKEIAGKGALLDGDSRWAVEWSFAKLETAAIRCSPDDYAYQDSGFSFHGPHVTEASRTLPNGVTLVYNNQSGVLLSDDREAWSPRNFATSYDRGTTYSVGDSNLADVMLLEDTDPDGDTVWLYHEWWYGKGPGSYEFIGGTGKWKGITGFGKTLGVLRDRVDDHWLIKSEMHWNLEGRFSTPTALKLGWRLSCQHYTLRDRGLFEAIDSLAGIGILNIEPTDFQKLKDGDETITDFRISRDKRREWKKHLADCGVSMPSYYVSKKEDLTDRRLWEFARDMRVEVICCEPEPGSLARVEQFCNEYGIKLAIHNHPEGRSIYWDPDQAMSLVAAQGPLGPAIGFCPDVGHWARSCVDVLDGLAKYRQQGIHVLHVKDIPESCKGWKDDAPLGSGVIPFLDILDSIWGWKWQGIITVELEAVPASLRNIALSAKYIEDYARARASAGVSAEGNPANRRDNRKWVELIASRRADLREWIHNTFQRAATGSRRSYRRGDQGAARR